MVQSSDSSKRRAGSTPHPDPSPPKVKLEVEESLDDERSPLHKRSRDASTSSQQALYNNVLGEPGPLGLRLRKSPSLADLIQMRLSQAKAGSTSCATNSKSSEVGDAKESKSSAASSSTSKIKASNFPASYLKIGAWEVRILLRKFLVVYKLLVRSFLPICVHISLLVEFVESSPCSIGKQCISRYEGDLVAKCYFAKHKLVWEVLEGGLKSKIEFHWSDITTIKATFSEGVNGTLEIVLARPPLFFRETDPQPRKHTLWQATQDFTNGQASIHRPLGRRHLLQCSQTLLSKNFEKLIDCDPRLKLLSQQPETILESPYFDPQFSVYEDQDDSNHFQDVIKDNCGTTFSGFCEPGSPCATSSISNKTETRDSFGRTPDFDSQDTPSPCSGNALVFYNFDTNVIVGIEARSGEENMGKDMDSRIQNWWDRLKLPGIRGSMSMTDLVNHLDHHISEQMASGNTSLPSNTLPDREMLEDIAHYLLNDSQSSAASSDEQSIISRVDSLCCLLHKDTAAGTKLNSKMKDSDDTQAGAGSDEEPYSTPEAELADGAQPPLSRKESYGELLILPRIASMPQFFNVPDDAEK
ncbi:hypothetical protein ZIOFF_037942 [Zingiber officinale]|uniref:TRF2/HOY1 PH-like domain-containing protein n=1 Tax=Zingiber officinale TaxID=94328 RepID=A0A8J5GLD5_ZINOF|nr:hypothetical protein ZIOFF_037942 [Zingiber officinale]